MNNERITGAEVIITLKNGSSISPTITLPETNPIPEYNVGDTVEVKTWVELKYEAERLDEDGSLILKDGVRFVKDGMEEHCGKRVKITEKRKIADGTYRYGIEGSRYNWTENMFVSSCDTVVRSKHLLQLLVEERDNIKREIASWQNSIISDMARLTKVENEIKRIKEELGE